MTTQPPASLRLHVEEQPSGPPAADPGQFAALSQAFHRSTGWLLDIEHAPASLGEVWSTGLETADDAPARLVLRAASPAERNAPAATLNDVRPLALAIAGMLNDAQRLRHAVWQREAELAAGVPVSRRPDDEAHLATRLEAVLKSGAEALGCTAAGLYMLNDSTTELKLRAAWGLPGERLLASPRPLRGAIADLEALTGHAVVLEDTSLLPHWRCPEDYPAAVCVPVSSPSIPLGTLWVFSDCLRDFTTQETNLLEIVAGRLAADLEREILLTTSQDVGELEKQIAAAERWQTDRLPSIAPLLDDYEIAGWTRQATGIGGDFHDWTVLNDGRLALFVGAAARQALEGGLSAAALHATAKTHAAYEHTAGGVLTRINDSLVADSPGGDHASLAYALLDPATGKFQLALAGHTTALLIGPENRLVTTTDEPCLGIAPHVQYSEDSALLHSGEALVLLSAGVREAVDPAGLRIGESALASFLARYLPESADALLARARRFLENGQQISRDLTLLIVKRRAH